MKKVTLFFCDIVGTFDGNQILKIEEEEIQRFVKNLRKIIKQNKTDGLIFSFVTTERKDLVRIMEQKIKPYLKDSDIYIGRHIYNKGKGNVAKPSAILLSIESLKEQYDVDSKVYYADDCELYHYILEELNTSYDITSIIPSSCGLVDVNNILEETSPIKIKKS